ncbi:MAG: protein-ADP-ribose hydrolase [Firmicutes bacterium]|nr:protein-ADP-ribose hydrolase [Bacillota bacterium]
MNVKELLTKGEELLEQAGKDSARHESRALYMFMKGLENTALLMRQRDQVDPETEEEYLELVEKRAEGTPLQHITGEQGFMGLNFMVNPSVLIPRPETEALVEEALRILGEEYDGETAAPKVLDICTGSGAIGISVKKHFPKAEVTLSDVSAAALDTAWLNTKLNECRAELMESDMFRALQGRVFDMILCNPPYISDEEIETLTEEVRDHEPRTALSGGADGLDFYRILAHEAADHLTPGGWLIMEIGYDQGETVPKLMEHLGETHVLKDLNGLDRVVTVHINGETMSQDDRLDYLVEAFKEDSLQYRGLETPQDTDGKRRILRSLMNIRMPKDLPQEVLTVQDEYLKARIEENGIVSVTDIPTVRDQGSTHAFADRISIWQGDITRLQADAIVNAANSQMLGCFVPMHTCIDNCIHTFAGVQLRAECDQNMRRLRARYGKSYEQPTAVPMLTEGYNLHARKVIHIVGPIVEYLLTPALEKDLSDCYRNTLDMCAENGLKTVAFCCISTGVFRFPNKRAADIAVETVTGWLEDHPVAMDRVIFNVFKDEDKQYYEENFY